MEFRVETEPGLTELTKTETSYKPPTDFLRICRRVFFRARNERGFSLVEVLVGGLLLAGVVVGLMRVFTSTSGFVPSQIAKSDQSNLGREKLEELNESVRQDWWSLTTQGLSLNGDGSARTTTDLAGGQRESKVSAVNTDGQDYRKVEITVHD